MLDGRKLKLSTKKRRFQNLPNKNSSVKLGILALLVLLLLFVFAKVFQFIYSLEQPQSSDLNTVKEYKWDSKLSLNLVLKDRNVSIFHFDPVDEKVIILSIPNNTYTELPKGYGSWRVESIYGLGQSEDPPVGALLLKQSLANLLGLPIDGILISKKDSLKDLLLSTSVAPWQFLGYLNQVKSDLTLREHLNLILAISKVRSDKIVYLNLEQTDITTSKLLPDSSRVLGVNKVALDQFVRDNMADGQILEERVSIAVFNATSHPGLAQEAARVITNLGGDVIIVSNTENLLAKTMVISQDENLTAAKLTQVFAPWCISEKCVTLDPKVIDSRAKINIVIGEDFYNFQKIR